MEFADLNQGFPKIQAEFVQPNRMITQTWLQLLISMWNRTGGGVGGSFDQFLRKDNNLSDLTDLPAARDNLGLGTAATYDVGTSGNTIPLLSGNNTWGGTNNFLVPIPIGSGGTGANTPAGARNNLGVSPTGQDPNYLLKSQNLADVPDKAAARANLGISDPSGAYLPLTGGTLTGPLGIGTPATSTFWLHVRQDNPGFGGMQVSNYHAGGYVGYRWDNGSYQSNFYMLGSAYGGGGVDSPNNGTVLYTNGPAISTSSPVFRVWNGGNETLRVEPNQMTIYGNFDVRQYTGGWSHCYNENTYTGGGAYWGLRCGDGSSYLLTTGPDYPTNSSWNRVNCAFLGTSCSNGLIIKSFYASIWMYPNNVEVMRLDSDAVHVWRPIYTGDTGYNGSVYYRRSYDALVMGRTFCDWDGGGGGLGLEADYGYPITFYTGMYGPGNSLGYERVRISAGGDFLVGTQASVWTYGGGSSRGIIEVNVGSYGGLIGFSTGGSGYGYLYHTGGDLLLSNQVGGELSFHTAGYRRLTLPAASTGSNLFRFSGEGATMYGYSDGSGTGITSASPYSDGAMFYLYGDQLRMYTNGYNRMMIWGNGVIQINNDADQQKALTINGNYIHLWIGADTGKAGVYSVDTTDSAWRPIAIGGSKVGFSINGQERAQVSDNAYFKASNIGDYGYWTQPTHVFYSNDGTFSYETMNIWSANADAPWGVMIRYINGGPNYSGNYFFRCYTDGQGDKAQIQSHGGFANFQAYDGNYSDAEMKTEITLFDDAALDLLERGFKAIDWCRYRYKNQATDKAFNYGYTAQGVEAVLPELVTEIDTSIRTEVIGPKRKLVYSTDLNNVSHALLARALKRIEVLEGRVT